MTRSTPSTPICNPQLPPPTDTNAGALQPSEVRHVATPRPCFPPKIKPPLIRSGTTRMHFALLRTSSGMPLSGVDMMACNLFARGALYDLLRNRLYLGEIRHHDLWYPGEDEGIVPRELWNKVQAQLTSNLRTRRHR